MKIVFDRGSLDLSVNPGEPLHPEAIETWDEANALLQKVLESVPDDVDELGRQLADASTDGLTHGRSDSVAEIFNQVESKLAQNVERQRRIVVHSALKIAGTTFLIGIVVGMLWLWLKGHSPWLALPRGFDLAANWILVTIGWTGFTMVGFALGWLFFQLIIIRESSAEDVSKHEITLRQTFTHVLYFSIACFFIVFALFFFDGFEKFDENLSIQLSSSPWAILVGVVAGFVQHKLVDWLKSLFKL